MTDEEDSIDIPVPPAARLRVGIGSTPRRWMRGDDPNAYVYDWYYYKEPPSGSLFDVEFEPAKSRQVFDTYAEVVAAARAAGHYVDLGGWRRRMLSWNHTSHSLQGYPGWEVESYANGRPDRPRPAWCKLEHVRRQGQDVESHVICAAWDDIAEADFYQRDWTDSGIPFCSDKEVYSSGWWFATIADRDRFVAWAAREHAGLILSISG
jgi:hypothetical protein